MDTNTWLSMPARARAYSTLAEVNSRLTAGGLSISRENARMLAKRRSEALMKTERVEFGTPAIVTIAKAVATSPRLSQDGLAQDLAVLQDAFYALRDELPADVPDAEIADALCGCLDAWATCRKSPRFRQKKPCVTQRNTRVRPR